MQQAPTNDNLARLWQLSRHHAGRFSIGSRHRHLDGSPRYVNALIEETSPYLLQHAHQPVNWRTWSATTLAEAKRLNRPLFLSIGYGSCHWCHVMASESFDNLDIARLLNDAFIPVKVDREQRPDIDTIYMTVLQILGGDSGWPLSVFLTPDAAPFMAGSYYPQAELTILLQRIHDLWRTQSERLSHQAARLSTALRNSLALPNQSPANTVTTRQLCDAVTAAILSQADPTGGGFGDTPKFPREHWLLFLLDQVIRDSRNIAEIPEWPLLEQTFEAMLGGGFRDLVGGGFHRYATDRHWQLPHFEKKLTTQALLAKVYTRAFAVSGKPQYRHVVREIIAFVLDELQTTEGVFAGSLDADSDGREGAYYLWSREELDNSLTAQQRKLAEQLFDLPEKGHLAGCYVLSMTHRQDAGSRQSVRPDPAACEDLLAVLRQARQQRNPPLRDDRIMTGWNGLMISTLAEAAEVMHEPCWLEVAETAATALWQYNRKPDGSLYRLSLERIGAEPAMLDDYACFMEAMLRLYDAGCDRIWLERAEALLTTLNEVYGTADQDLYYLNDAATASELMVRPCILADQDTGCGNAVMVRVMADLYRRTGDTLIRDQLQRHQRALKGALYARPLSQTTLIDALQYAESPPSYGPCYARDGQLRGTIRTLSATRDTLLELRLTITMSEGWHLQSHQCLSGDKRRTCLELLSESHHQCLDIRFPPEKTWQTAAGEELEIYPDQCEIDLTVHMDSHAPVRLRLHLMTCNEHQLHQPATMDFTVWS